MTWFRHQILGGILVLLGAAHLWTSSADAHPHAWIDLDSAVVFNDAGQMVAIEQYWLFGDFYSAYLVSDITDSGDDLIEGLRETARGNLIELRGYDYFTRVLVDGERASFDDVGQFETGIIEGRVYLKFTLSLSTPIDPRGQAVKYAVYDPTYYVEVLHAEGAEPKVRGSANNCALALTRPEPTFEELAYAASLDQDESGGDGLGAAFAEWVSLTCQ